MAPNTNIPSTEQSDDDAWDAVLSDPENQKTLAELVKSIKDDAQAGSFGEPEVIPADPSDKP